MMMILVTGAEGHIGRELVPLLLERGAKVRIAMTGAHSHHDALDVERISIDAYNSDSLTAAFSGVDRLFLLSPFWVDQIEVEQNLVDAAHQAEVGFIVKQSVAGADEGGDYPLAARHRTIEAHIRKLNIRHAFLHPSPFMQDFLLYGAETIRKEDLFMRPGAEGRTSFIDAADAAQAAVEVLLGDTTTDRSYRLTGNEAITNIEAASILSEVLQRPIRYVDVIRDEFRNWLRAQNIAEREIDILLELNQIQRNGLAADVTSTVKDLAGITPKSFREFVEMNRSAFEIERETDAEKTHIHGEAHP